MEIKTPFFGSDKLKEDQIRHRSCLLYYSNENRISNYNTSNHFQDIKQTNNLYRVM